MKKVKVRDEEYDLEDKDAVLTMAIQDLTIEIHELRLRM